MKHAFLYFFLLTVLTGSKVENGYRYIPFDSFGEGEKMYYRVHYGFITGGEATMFIDEKIHKLNNRPCYKIEVYGKTTGLTDKLFNVRDTWGTYLDTAAVVPHKSYRYIREGGYRKNEVVNFDQLKKQAFVNKLTKETKELKEIKQYEVPKNVQDMVSGYYYLRTLNYDNMKEDQIIKVDAFFDEEVYDFRVKFKGREKVKTKLGEMNAIVLEPIMPENDLFSGENPIRVWISDDQHKIPLRIKANMFVGSIEIAIREYRKPTK